MKKILIVEDDFYIRDIYSKNFSQSGYSIDVAVDGEEAIEKVKTNSYDLILLDIMLPKKTGIEVLRSYRDPRSPVKNTPVFIITNLGQEDIIKEAFKIGADGYLIKAQLTPKDIVGEINNFFAEQEKLTAANPPPKTTV